MPEAILLHFPCASIPGWSLMPGTASDTGAASDAGYCFRCRVLLQIPEPALDSWAALVRTALGLARAVVLASWPGPLLPESDSEPGEEPEPGFSVSGAFVGWLPEGSAGAAAARAAASRSLFLIRMFGAFRSLCGFA